MCSSENRNRGGADLSSTSLIKTIVLGPSGMMDSRDHRHSPLHALHRPASRRREVGVSRSRFRAARSPLADRPQAPRHLAHGVNLGRRDGRPFPAPLRDRRPLGPPTPRASLIHAAAWYGELPRPCAVFANRLRMDSRGRAVRSRRSCGDFASPASLAIDRMQKRKMPRERRRGHAAGTSAGIRPL